MSNKTERLKAIERIEQRLGVALPEEYRDYVLDGVPWDDERCVLAWGAGKDYPFVVDVRAPYDCELPGKRKSRNDAEEPTIEFMLEVFNERLPGDGLIPEDAICVASCESDEEIVLFIRGRRRGEVWIKDWRMLEDTGVDEPESGMHFVASSFKEFLNKLGVEDAVEDDEDDEQRVILYIPDPQRKLDFSFGSHFPPAEELDRTGVGEWDSVGYDKPKWRLGFGGPSAQRIIDVLRPALNDLALPSGSFLLIDDDPSERIDL